MYKKIGKIVIETSVNGQRTKETNYIFYSYDKGSAVFDFRLKNQKNEALDLTNVTVKLLFTGVQDGEERKFTYLDSQPIIENPEEGRILYPLPDKLLNYEGEIKGYLYLDFEDGSHSDELSFTFTVIRSKIDSNIEEISEVYIKDFEQIKKEIFELAEREKEAIETLRPGLESSVSQLNEQVGILGEKVEVNHTETNRLLQLIEANGALTREDFILALARGYFEFTRTVDFIGKISGSIIENPNHAASKYLWSTDMEPPTPYTSIGEIGKSSYKCLAGENTSVSLVSNNGYPERKILLYMRLQWNIIEEIKRWLGNRYFDIVGAETTEKQAEFVEKNLNAITPSFYGYGKTFSKGEAVKNNLGGFWYDNHSLQWEEYVRSTKGNYSTLEETVTKKEKQRFLDNQGRVNLLMVTGLGENAYLYYGKTTLQFTYRIYLSDILYYKRDPTIDRMQTQIQQLWDKVFKQ
ncbi:BppU family phage baseplate upper protein [Enterococcus faecalis]